jgi:hypothetical protein
MHKLEIGLELLEAVIKIILTASHPHNSHATIQNVVDALNQVKTVQNEGS